MPRPKTVSPQISGRDRLKDVNAFALEPLSTLPDSVRRLDGYAAYFYKEIGNALVAVKQLRIVDIPSLENAAAYYSFCHTAMDKLYEEDGLIQRSQNGFLQASPYVSVHEKYAKLLQQFADRYGLNLISATKIPKAKTDKNSLNDMFEK